MNYSLIKSDFNNDTLLYCLGQESESFNNLMLRCADISGDSMYVLYGNIQNNSQIPAFFKVNLINYTLSPFDLTLDIGATSVEYRSMTFAQIFATHADNKGFIVNNNFYTIMHSPSPTNALMLVSINLTTSFVSFKKITHASLTANTTILGLELIGTNIFIIAKEGNANTTMFNKVYAVDYQSATAIKYDVNDLRIVYGNAVTSYGNVIYFVGGKYLNPSTSLVDAVSNKIFTFNTVSLAVSEISFENSPTVLPAYMDTPNAMAIDNKIYIVPQKESSVTQRSIYIYDIDDSTLYRNNYSDLLASGLIFKYYDGNSLIYNPAQCTVWVNKLPSLLNLVASNNIQFSITENKSVDDSTSYFNVKQSKVSDSVFISRIITQRLTLISGD